MRSTLRARCLVEARGPAAGRRRTLGRGERGGRGLVAAAALALTALPGWTLLPLPAPAADREPVPPTAAQEPPLDTASLADGPWSRMEMLLERTIFRVNVLTLTVRLGPEPAGRIEELVRAGGAAEAVEDSVARVAARATDAFARLEFRRTVSLERFVREVRANLGRAVADGYLGEADARRIGAGMPRWFSFLEERKIREGDRILYRVRGDTLRTLFVAADGEVLLDQTDVGPERRLAVLGSYFARGSDFRLPLIRSLLERGPPPRRHPG